MSITTRPTPRVLLIGGAGYIGGHTALALHDAGIPVAILDNFSTSTPEAWDNLAQHLPNASFHKGDARDARVVEAALKASQSTQVIHFAALKSVPESMHKPLLYHAHNSQALLGTLEGMDSAGVWSIVFSSSAAVYGAAPSPIHETTPSQPANPYGATKAWAERILSDLCHSDPRWQATALRYFNPVGADPKMRFGELNRQAGNVAPIIGQAILKGDTFSITGADFDTPDGTGLRDYIHIADLAEAHKAAVGRQETGFAALNIGTGKPTSVMELVHAFEKTAGKKLHTNITSRRPGDVGACWASVGEAEKVLQWKAKHTVDDMARDALCWINLSSNRKR